MNIEESNRPNIQRVKGQLVTQLDFRVQMIVGDCKTIGRVRLDKGEWFKQESLGGGNFIMAHALFALLNLLAKTFRYLVAPGEFATKASGELVEQSIKRIKAASIDPAVTATGHGNDLAEVVKIAKKDKHASWKKPRIGDCNEKTAFGHLAMSVKAHLDLGFSTHREAEEVWQQIRNELAHMALPKAVIGVWQSVPQFPTYESWKEAMKGRRPFFRGPGNRWLCDVDRLTLCVPEIAEWVCNEVAKCQNETLLRDLVMWMTGAEWKGDGKNNV